MEQQLEIFGKFFGEVSGEILGETFGPTASFTPCSQAVVHSGADLTELTAPSDEVLSMPLLAAGEPPTEEQRIRQLEQALYQCQLYIDELKQKLIDQEFLEDQLATTEAFSHIQKQAIETLKAQVTDQLTLATELKTLQQQMKSIQSELADTAAALQQKETDFSTLRLQALQEQAEIDRLRDKNAQLTAQMSTLQSSMVQETQQRIIAQKTADRLRLEMRSHDVATRALEAKLQRAEGMLTHREEMITALKDLNRPDSQKDQFIQGISSTLLKAQRQITNLENELSNQSILQAQLQHTTYELEQDTKVTQVRSEQLENQVNDLQEQVLRQAQQASEYETAVQHWKTRCLEAEEWTTQVAQTWETLKAEQPRPGAISPDLTKTLTALSRWFKGSKGGLSLTDPQVMSPKDLLGMRSRWHNF